MGMERATPSVAGTPGLLEHIEHAVNLAELVEGSPQAAHRFGRHSRARKRGGQRDFAGHRRSDLRRRRGHALIATADSLNEADPLGFDDALHPADRKTLPVQKVPDPLEEIHVVGAIVAPSTAALEWPDLVEASLPEPEDVLRKVEILRYLGNRAEGIGALVHGGIVSHEKHRFHSRGSDRRRPGLAVAWKPDRPHEQRG